MESWKTIPDFPNYAVSDQGRIMNKHTERIMALMVNQTNVVMVGLVKDLVQYKRGVARLVAEAFIVPPAHYFNTPINLNGDRFDNRVENLAWRPRWFAVLYNKQFSRPYYDPIFDPIQDIRTGEISENSFECAIRYGLLEKDVVLAIRNRTYVVPTFQEFRVIQE